jgi:hypothetical protein
VTPAARRAEVLKLARLLDRTPEELAYLEKVEAEDIRVLRRQATDALFGTSSDILQRTAAANRLLPTKVLSSIAERALGPVIVARLSGMIDPGRAVDVAEKLPTEFLADVAVWIDPRRSNEVIGRIPPAQIAAVAEVLLDRGEYVAMGMFVGHLSDDALIATFEVIQDHELLLVGFVLEDKDRLDHVMRLLPDDRVDGIVTAVVEHDLWEEALDLLSHLEPDRRGQFYAAGDELGISLPGGELPAA